MKKISKEFANNLKLGFRKDGLSIEECCVAWNITLEEYYKFVEQDKEFEYAHQIGERDARAWWHMTHRRVSDAGNATCLNFAMKNINKWVDKQEVEAKEEEVVRSIKIEVLPPRDIKPKEIKEDD